MDDVRGDVLGPSHGTTSAAVIANKILKLTQKWTHPKVHYEIILLYGESS